MEDVTEVAGQSTFFLHVAGGVCIGRRLETERRTKGRKLARTLEEEVEERGEENDHDSRFAGKILYCF